MAHDRSSRRDQAGTGPDPSESRRRLVSIDDLDGYRVAEGEPDVRGWDVATLSGRELGEVEDLLVDPERGEVVMLEVVLRGDGVHTEVPIRSVQLDRDRKTVVVDSGEVDDHVRHEIRARDRVDAAERDRVRDTFRGSDREVRYDTRSGDARDVRDARAEREGPESDETVIERRPMIEEVVVRRRKLEE
jgi:sporulation protein YlmC with PRC-barrel domain